MSKKRKLLIWSGVVAGTVLVIVTILLLLVSRYINSEPTQKKIRAIVTEKIGETVTYQQVGLTIFPRPGLVFTKTNITIPETAVISMPAAKIYPELLPLFTGEMRLAKLKFENPDVTLNIEEKTTEEAKSKPFSLAETIAEITSVRSSIRSFAPRLVFVVQQGRLVVRENKRQMMEVNDLNTRIAIIPKGLEISFQGNVGKWGRIAATGEFLGKGNSVLINDLSVSTGQSSVSISSGKLRLEKKPFLEIDSANAALVLDDIEARRSWLGKIYNPLSQIKKLQGTIKLASLKISGALFNPAEWIIDTSGRVKDMDVDFSPLPGPVKITRGQFSMIRNNLTVKNVQAAIFDSSLSASALISGSLQNIDSVDVVVNADIGPQTVQWVSKTCNLPPEQTVRAPLMISDAHIVWQKGSALAVTGTAAVNNGPTLRIDLRKYGQELAIKQLIIRDQDSHAGITLTYGGNLVDFSFMGSLTEKTLNRMFADTSFYHGWIKGDFLVRVVFNNLSKSVAQGHLEGAHLIIPVGINAPVKISHVNVRADNRTLTVESAGLSIGKNDFDLKGNIQAYKDALQINMDISADSIKVDDIQEALAFDKKAGAAEQTEPSEKRPPKNRILQGIIRLNAKSITWGRYKVSPLRADLELARKGLRAAITQASLCGIALPGNLTFINQDIKLDFQPAATGMQFDPSLNCLLGTNMRISGTVDLKASVTARGKPSALVNALQGKAELRAKDGCIYSYPLLAKILSFLNVTELLRGKIPDLAAEGLDYNSITIKGYFHNGNFVLQEAVIDGTTMQLVAEGEIDLSAKKVNLTVLVAPFKTIDYLVSKIPLVRYVFKGTLISIPLRVTGPLDDPDIFILSPTAVGQGLFGMMKRTLELPFKIVEPIIPKGKEKEP